MNELTDRPYRILMDAAHNLHGMRALMTYLDQQATTGRRTLVVGPSRRFNEAKIGQMAALLAPRFDRFFCKRYRPRGKAHHQPGAVARAA
jgi:folylpolyglutamate synthase/dihydropteroate synthase